MEGLSYTAVAHPIKGFLNVEANKLQAFVVVVCFLNEVSGQDRWFLNSLLCHEAVLVCTNNSGQDAVEPSG